MAELNVRKRGQKWEYRFEGAKVDGKRNQFSKGGFHTKKECLEAGTKALAEFNHAGIHFEPSEISVADYLDYWFDNYCKMNLKYNTQLNYIQIIENHLKPTFGKYKLKALNAAVIQEYTNTLKVKGLSKSTVVGIITTLSGALNYAIEPMRYLTYNPCNPIKYPKFEANIQTRFVIPRSDFKKIIERFSEESPYHIPLLIGFYTGLRISEAFALTWDDIDFENKTLTVNKITVKRNFGIDVRQVLVQKGKKEEKSSWYFGSPKTESSNRTIKIGDTLLDALKRLHKRQMENSSTYGEFYTEHYLKEEIDEKGNTLFRIIPAQKVLPCSLQKVNLICVRENGEYSSTDSFKFCARIIHHELGIPFNYHSLRHTHATMLIEAGVNIKSIQERLGHANITTTLQVYTKNTPTMESNLVDVFENIANKDSAHQ